MWFLGVQITILEKTISTSARDVRTATFKHDNNIWSLLGKELWTFAALAGVLCDSIVVDELPTSLPCKNVFFLHVQSALWQQILKGNSL